MAPRLEPTSHMAFTQPRDRGIKDFDGPWSNRDVAQLFRDLYDHDHNGWINLHPGQPAATDERLRSVNGDHAVSGYETLRKFDWNPRDHRITSPEIYYTILYRYDHDNNGVLDDTPYHAIDGNTGKEVFISERQHFENALTKESDISAKDIDRIAAAYDAADVPDTPPGWLPDPTFQTGPHPIRSGQ